MTVTMHEPSTTGSARNGIAARLLVPGFWGAVSIVAMWPAVLFDGVFGGDMVLSNQSNPAGGPTIIGPVVPVALFACLATISVVRRAFRGRDANRFPEPSVAQTPLRLIGRFSISGGAYGEVDALRLRSRDQDCPPLGIRRPP